MARQDYFTRHSNIIKLKGGNKEKNPIKCNIADFLFARPIAIMQYIWISKKAAQLRTCS